MVLAIITFTLRAHAGNIAVFCALDADITALKKELGGTATTYHSGSRKVTLIKTETLVVHVARMRPGAAMAAVDAESVLAGRPWRLVISVGPCGSLRENLETGTWGIVTKQHY